jgi:hypothetical protein
MSDMHVFCKMKGERFFTKYITGNSAVEIRSLSYVHNVYIQK